MAKDSAGRRAHRAKTGCWTCRQRKVRCDEAKPFCNNCERLSLKCEGYKPRITWRDDSRRMFVKEKAKVKVTDDTGEASEYGSPQYEPGRFKYQKITYRHYTADHFEQHHDFDADSDVLDESEESIQSPVDSVAHRSMNHSYYQSMNGLAYAQQQPYPGPEHGGRQQPWLATSISQHRSNLVTSIPYCSPAAHMPPVVAMSQQQMRGTSMSHYHQDPWNYHEALHGQPLRSQRSNSTDESMQPLLPTNQYLMHDHYISPPPLAPNHASYVRLPHGMDRRSSQTASDLFDAGVKQAPIQGHSESYFEVMPRQSTTSGEVSPNSDTGVNETFLAQEQLQAIYLQLSKFILSAAELKEAEVYIRHYLSQLARQLSFPDRGQINPFRMLVTSLCPNEPVLLQAILAYSASDLGHNSSSIDSERAFAQAQSFFDTAKEALIRQLDDPTADTPSTSTSALATAYFLSLTDVKHARPISLTSISQRIVTMRSQAGQIFNGGVCWTWNLATLGIASAAFGGPHAIMPYLVKSDQLPTPGQGNMYPFIKKTEEQRVEHSLISQMYVSVQQWWITISELAELANNDSTLSDSDFQALVSNIKDRIEKEWANRPSLVDELTSDDIEADFPKKYILGPPIAEQIVCFYHTARLYTELLVRKSYTTQELKESVLKIAHIFDSITATNSTFQRRHFLISIFLCTIMCPDFSLREQMINKLAQSMSTEASWNRAFGVAAALLEEEMMGGNEPGGSPLRSPTGYGSIKWSDVRDKLKKVTLF